MPSTLAPVNEPPSTGDVRRARRFLAWAFLLPAVLHCEAPATPAAPAAASPATSTLRSAPAKPFEGVIAMRLSLEAGGGDMALSLTGGDARLDMKVKVAPLPEPVSLAILHRAKSPRQVALLDDARRTWSEVDLAEAGAAAAADGKGPYAVKLLGKGEHLGYPCDHVTLTRDREFVDAWIAPGFKDAFAALRTLQEANPQVGEAGIFRALEKAGHAGLPMRLTVIREGQRVSTEVVRLDRGAVPAARFEVPAGYKRLEAAPSR